MKIEISNNYSFESFLNLNVYSDLFSIKVYEHCFNPIELNVNEVVNNFSNKLSSIIFKENIFTFLNPVWKGENKILNKKRAIYSSFSTNNNIAPDQINIEFDKILYKFEYGNIYSLELLSEFISNFQNIYSSNSNILFENLSSNYSLSKIQELYMVNLDNQLVIRFDKISKLIGNYFDKVYLMDPDLEYGVLRVVSLSKKL